MSAGPVAITASLRKLGQRQVCAPALESGRDGRIEVERLGEERQRFVRRALGLSDSTQRASAARNALSVPGGLENREALRGALARARQLAGQQIRLGQYGQEPPTGLSLGCDGGDGVQRLLEERNGRARVL